MQDKKEGKSGGGFLWGAVIGGALTYLITTERGREILKELFNEGIDIVSDMTSPEPEEDPGVYNEEAITVTPEGETEAATEDTKEEHRRKRFFRARRK